MEGSGLQEVMEENNQSLYFESLYFQSLYFESIHTLPLKNEFRHLGSTLKLYFKTVCHEIPLLSKGKFVVRQTRSPDDTTV